MKYYYVMSDIVRPYYEGVYYTMDEMKEVRVIAENDPELVKVWDEAWPIYNPGGWSTKAAECENIEQAYRYLLNNQNDSVASYLMDI